MSCLPRSFVVALLACVATAPAAPAANAEFAVKAAFLYNFGLFVTWPAKAFEDEKAPFVIGVLGKDPFGKLLDPLARKRVKGRRVVVRRPKKDQGTRGCHILFVARTEAKRLAAIWKHLDRNPTLTVGDVDRFAHRGGMIGMRVVKGKIRLQFNLEACRRAGLKIHPKLLQLGEVVK